MRLLVGWGLLALVVLGTSSLPVAVVQASTIQGNAVTISGLDDLNATVDQQSRKGIGKILALGLGAAGLAGMATGYHMTGAVGVGAGVAVGFLPGIISSAFDQAPAATDLAVQVGSTAWWAPLSVGLYPALLAVRLLQDPVFIVGLALIVVGVQLTRWARQQVG